jgi:hypothetical protein
LGLLARPEQHNRESYLTISASPTGFLRERGRLYGGINMHYPPHVRIIKPNPERRSSDDNWLSRSSNPFNKDSCLFLLGSRLRCVRRALEKIS